MQAHFEIYNENEELVLDLADKVAGDVVFISTGKSNGSYTVTTSGTELAEFAYQVVVVIGTSGAPSRFPYINTMGNKVSWAFDESGNNQNQPIDILAFKY